MVSVLIDKNLLQKLGKLPRVRIIKLLQPSAGAACCWGGRRCRHEPALGPALLTLCAPSSRPSGPLPPLGFFFPQSATDIAQIRELQTQVEDVKKEKQSLQEKVIPPPPARCTQSCGAGAIRPFADLSVPGASPVLVVDAVFSSEMRSSLCPGVQSHFPFAAWSGSSALANRLCVPREQHPAEAVGRTGLGRAAGLCQQCPGAGESFPWQGSGDGDPHFSLLPSRATGAIAGAALRG